MKVWILMVVSLGEGEEIEGVYASEARAEEECERRQGKEEADAKARYPWAEGEALRLRTPTHYIEEWDVRA